MYYGWVLGLQLLKQRLRQYLKESLLCRHRKKEQSSASTTSLKQALFSIETCFFLLAMACLAAYSGFVTQQNYIWDSLMEPSVSIENQRIALELKYLLSLEDKVTEEQILAALNKLYPFNIYTLKKVPPLQYIEYEAGAIITPNLREIIESYSLLIILGKCKIHKQIYSIDEQRFIDQSIRDRLVFNFDEGQTELKAINRVKLLKVHNIWVKKAKQAYEANAKAYIRNKLLAIPFFSKLTFEEFNKICMKAELNVLGPGEALVKQNFTPYHMYIITEGQLSIQKQVKLVSEGPVWRQVQISSQKRNQYCEQLFEYLVRDPIATNDTFSINFMIKTVGQGAVLCGTQTLSQMPLSYSIISTLKSKYISIKYPDLYVLEQSRLSEIRSWPLFTVDSKQLRRQYYYQKNWEDYKQYLMDDQKLTQMQAQHFYDFLRKDVNMSMKKYNYSSNKVGQGYVTDSPAAKMNRVREMTYKIN